MSSRSGRKKDPGASSRNDRRAEDTRPTSFTANEASEYAQNGRSRRDDRPDNRSRKSQEYGHEEARQETTKSYGDRSDEGDRSLSQPALPMTGQPAHVPDQFPGQVPMEYSLPYRPQMTQAQSFGEASEYYQDQGQSVASQPGIRPGTPIFTDASQSHLQSASATANPAQDTGNGSAAEFYNAASTSTQPSAPPSYSPQPPSTYTRPADESDRPSQYPPVPSSTPGSSNMIPLALGAAGLAAAGYAHHQHENHQKPDKDDHYTQQSSAYGQQSLTAGPSRPQHQHQHQHHSPPRRRGAFGKFVDWWNDHEDVRKMEEYTEYIGVCRYCFDPRSSVGDAPRRHHWHKHRHGSRERRHRVDKENRYSSSSSSESETSRRRHSARRRHSPRLERQYSDRRSEQSYGVIEVVEESRSKASDERRRGSDRYEAERSRTAGHHANSFSPSSYTIRRERINEDGVIVDVEESQHRRSRSSKRKRAGQDYHASTSSATEALIGLGARAAALASTDRHGSQHRADLLRQSHSRRQGLRRRDSEASWESVSEGNSSSNVDSDLAFGDVEVERTVKRRASEESMSSDNSGTGAWGWRWRKGGSRRQRDLEKGRRRQISERDTAVSVERSSESTISERRKKLPLQDLGPQPYSPKPAIIMHDAEAGTPLYQPQPVSPPKSYATYERQSEWLAQSDNSSGRPILPHSQSAPADMLYGTQAPRRGLREDIRVSRMEFDTSGQSHSSQSKLEHDKVFAGEAEAWQSAIPLAGVATGMKTSGSGSRGRKGSVRFADVDPEQEEQHSTAVHHSRRGSRGSISSDNDHGQHYQDDKPEHMMTTENEKHDNDLSVEEVPEPVYRTYSQDDQRDYAEPILDDDLNDPNFFKKKRTVSQEADAPRREDTYQDRRPSEGQEHSEPIMDDDLDDPDFFKKSRSRKSKDSVDQNEAISTMFADFEDRYNQDTATQSQADFFRPKDLSSSASATDRRVDAVIPENSDGDSDLARDRSSIPQLRVIPATPPPDPAQQARQRTQEPRRSPLREFEVQSRDRAEGAGDVHDEHASRHDRPTSHEHTPRRPESPERTMSQSHENQLERQSYDQPHDDDTDAGDSDVLDLVAAKVEEEMPGGFHEERDSERNGRPDAPADASGGNFDPDREAAREALAGATMNVESTEGGTWEEPKATDQLHDDIQHAHEHVDAAAYRPPPAYAFSQFVDVEKGGLPFHFATKSVIDQLPKMKTPTESELEQMKPASPQQRGYKHSIPDIMPSSQFIDVESGAMPFQFATTSILDQLPRTTTPTDLETEPERSTSPQERGNKRSIPDIMPSSQFIDVESGAMPFHFATTSVLDQLPRITMPTESETKRRRFASPSERSNKRSIPDIMPIPFSMAPTKQLKSPSPTRATSITSPKDDPRRRSAILAFQSHSDAIPELTPLPDSRPGSPYSEGSSSPALPPLPAIPATVPVSEPRTPSSTAIPLRFLRHNHPQSPSWSRGSPTSMRIASSPVLDLETSAALSPSTPSRPKSRPTSGEFKNWHEFRPLYLVERNTKAEDTDDSVEALPALPPSNNGSIAGSMLGSRAPSLKDGDEADMETFVSAAQTPANSFAQHREDEVADTVTHDYFDDFERHLYGRSARGIEHFADDVAYLDSQQATPRASALASLLGSTQGSIDDDVPDLDIGDETVLHHEVENPEELYPGPRSEGTTPFETPFEYSVVPKPGERNEHSPGTATTQEADAEPGAEPPRKSSIVSSGLSTITAVAAGLSSLIGSRTTEPDSSSAAQQSEEKVNEDTASAERSEEPDDFWSALPLSKKEKKKLKKQGRQASQFADTTAFTASDALKDVADEAGSTPTVPDREVVDRDIESMPNKENSDAVDWNIAPVSTSKKDKRKAKKAKKGTPFAWEDKIATPPPDPEAEQAPRSVDDGSIIENSIDSQAEAAEAIEEQDERSKAKSEESEGTVNESMLDHASRAAGGDAAEDASHTIDEARLSAAPDSPTSDDTPTVRPDVLNEPSTGNTEITADELVAERVFDEAFETRPMSKKEKKKAKKAAERAQLAQAARDDDHDYEEDAPEQENHDLPERDVALPATEIDLESSEPDNSQKLDASVSDPIVVPENAVIDEDEPDESFDAPPMSKKEKKKAKRAAERARSLQALQGDHDDKGDIAEKEKDDVAQPDLIDVASIPDLESIDPTTDKDRVVSGLGDHNDALADADEVEEPFELRHMSKKDKKKAKKLARQQAENKRKLLFSEPQSVASPDAFDESISDDRADVEDVPEHAQSTQDKTVTPENEHAFVDKADDELALSKPDMLMEADASLPEAVATKNDDEKEAAEVSEIQAAEEGRHFDDTVAESAHTSRPSSSKNEVHDAEVADNQESAEHGHNNLDEPDASTIADLDIAANIGTGANDEALASKHVVEQEHEGSKASGSQSHGAKEVPIAGNRAAAGSGTDDKVTMPNEADVQTAHESSGASGAQSIHEFNEVPAGDSEAADDIGTNDGASRAHPVVDPVTQEDFETPEVQSTGAPKEVPEKDDWAFPVEVKKGKKGKKGRTSLLEDEDTSEPQTPVSETEPVSNEPDARATGESDARQPESMPDEFQASFDTAQNVVWSASSAQAAEEVSNDDWAYPIKTKKGKKGRKSLLEEDNTSESQAPTSEAEPGTNEPDTGAANDANPRQSDLAPEDVQTESSTAQKSPLYPPSAQRPQEANDHDWAYPIKTKKGKKGKKDKAPAWTETLETPPAESSQMKSPSETPADDKTASAQANDDWAMPTKKSKKGKKAKSRGIPFDWAPEAEEVMPDAEKDATYVATTKADTTADEDARDVLEAEAPVQDVVPPPRDDDNVREEHPTRFEAEDTSATEDSPAPDTQQIGHEGSREDHASATSAKDKSPRSSSEDMSTNHDQHDANMPAPSAELPPQPAWTKAHAADPAQLSNTELEHSQSRVASPIQQLTTQVSPTAEAEKDVPWSSTYVNQWATIADVIRRGGDESEILATKQDDEVVQPHTVMNINKLNSEHDLEIGEPPIESGDRAATGEQTAAESDEMDKHRIMTDNSGSSAEIFSDHVDEGRSRDAEDAEHSGDKPTGFDPASEHSGAPADAPSVSTSDYLLHEPDVWDFPIRSKKTGKKGRAATTGSLQADANLAEQSGPAGALAAPALAPQSATTDSSAEVDQTLSHVPEAKSVDTAAYTTPAEPTLTQARSKKKKKKSRYDDLGSNYMGEDWWSTPSAAPVTDETSHQVKDHDLGENDKVDPAPVSADTAERTVADTSKIDELIAEEEAVETLSQDGPPSSAQEHYGKLGSASPAEENARTEPGKTTSGRQNVPDVPGPVEADDWSTSSASSRKKKKGKKAKFQPFDFADAPSDPITLVEETLEPTAKLASSWTREAPTKFSWADEMEALDAEEAAPAKESEFKPENHEHKSIPETPDQSFMQARFLEKEELDDDAIVQELAEEGMLPKVQTTVQPVPATHLQDEPQSLDALSEPPLTGEGEPPTAAEEEWPAFTVSSKKSKKQKRKEKKPQSNAFTALAEDAELKERDRLSEMADLEKTATTEESPFDTKYGHPQAEVSDESAAERHDLRDGEGGEDNNRIDEINDLERAVTSQEPLAVAPDDETNFARSLSRGRDREQTYDWESALSATLDEAGFDPNMAARYKSGPPSGAEGSALDEDDEEAFRRRLSLERRRKRRSRSNVRDDASERGERRERAQQEESQSKVEASFDDIVSASLTSAGFHDAQYPSRSATPPAQDEEEEIGVREPSATGAANAWRTMSRPHTPPHHNQQQVEDVSVIPEKRDAEPPAEEAAEEFTFTTKKKKKKNKKSKVGVGGRLPSPVTPSTPSVAKDNAQVEEPVPEPQRGGVETADPQEGDEMTGHQASIDVHAREAATWSLDNIKTRPLSMIPEQDNDQDFETPHKGHVEIEDIVEDEPLYSAAAVAARVFAAPLVSGDHATATMHTAADNVDMPLTVNKQRNLTSPTPSELANTRRQYLRGAGILLPPSNQASFQSPYASPAASDISNRSRSVTPILRRTDRKLSGDLRSLSRASGGEAREPEARALDSPTSSAVGLTTTTSDIVDKRSDYDALRGAGTGRMSEISQQHEEWRDTKTSPRPLPSLYRKQSKQMLDLERQLAQVTAENEALRAGRRRNEDGSKMYTPDMAAESQSDMAARDQSLRAKDAEVTQLRAKLSVLQQEALKLREHNEQLQAANRNLRDDAEDRYAQLQAEHDAERDEWQQTSRELTELRQTHEHVTSNMEEAISGQISNALVAKDAEIRNLRLELDRMGDQVTTLRHEILALQNNEDYLTRRDEDYFDSACQQLCQHIQQWILRFSKFSDSRTCVFTDSIDDERIAGRLENAMLDGTDVDVYLADRIKRRDVFMSLVMSMIWEYVFTRYLFGLERSQRQQLKALERSLTDIGPARAVATWRATTLTLLSRLPSFDAQRRQDTEAVVQEILTTLSALLPPPDHLRGQLTDSLRAILTLAVSLSIEMRTRRPEYIMLPPLHPEYDSNGTLVRRVLFNASLMNERSGAKQDGSDEAVSNDEYEARGAVVRLVLFPLVVKKGDESGEGDEEIVVCPAQVLVARPGVERPRKVVRMSSRYEVMEGATEVSAVSGRSEMSVER